jgi:ParB-like chromosome segregation protein Spo0J
VTIVGRTFGAIYVPIESVQEHPENYREHDEGLIAESITRLGSGEAWRALVVQGSTGYVLVGNGQLKAHRLRGDREVPVLYRDLDDATARAVMLADNWIPTHGRDLAPELLALMRELQDERELFEATGADADDLAALEREVADLDTPLDLGASQSSRKARLVKAVCPECGHKFEIGKT